MTSSDDPRALLIEAARLHRQGRLEEAESAYARLLDREPVDPAALINAGALALVRGDIASAVARLTRAVAAAPVHAVARNNLGYALLQANREEEALVALDAAIRLQPNYAQAHNNRGIALVRLARRDEAIEAFRRALELQPDAVDAAVNLGNQHRNAGDAAAAAAAFDHALARVPGNVEARIGRAVAEALAGDLEGAIAALERVVADHPESASGWQNLGMVCSWAWRHGRAEVAYAKALECDPADGEAQGGLALTLLAVGRYADGFAAYEKRREGLFGAGGRFSDLRAWDGGPLRGTLLLYAEQGLGDVVQFCRYAHAARSRVGRIVLLLDGYWAPLAPLLRSLAGIDRIVLRREELAEETVAARASVLSLPFVTGLTVPAIRGDAYLTAPADYEAPWRTRIAGLGSCAVGLAWSVTVRDEHAYVTRHKSVPAAALASLLDTPGVAFVTLQPGAAGDPAPFGPRAGRIADVRPYLRDFGDTSALIAALDLVISADTAVAHVAGALGKPVWLLDRYNCCWRWRLAPRTSPWYHSMRIFRQQRFGDWSAPLADATAALVEFAQPYRLQSS